MSHLSHFPTGGLVLLIAKIIFKQDAIYILTDDRRHQLGNGPWSFNLHVTYKQFDWQIDSSAQICGALSTRLCGIEEHTLEFEVQREPAEWQDDTVDGATWRELLEPFTEVRKLHKCQVLAWELSCALQRAEIRSDLELRSDLSSPPNSKKSMPTMRLSRSWRLVKPWVAQCCYRLCHFQAKSLGR